MIKIAKIIILILTKKIIKILKIVIMMKNKNINIIGLKTLLIILKIDIMNTIINYLKKRLNYFL